jgi:Tol biopolymer transport system component/predicted Ser/Thr protein kinase
MSILPGRRLGPYEILSAIGAGGMGEVYKARDTRLDRIVAIKVLPAHLADRAELRERFDREAKTIASLNHPHICTLYDTGHQNEIDFLVMEYLEGETLAQRLVKGALPIQQVLQFAIEIADALDKAHRKGVTHRDLKPGNIMITKSGTKLLDFGLAKLTQEVAPATPVSQLPTANDAITAQGTILGTLLYMAPEQLEGKEADARTDIFAFGAVVYEMATGKKAFAGKSQASVIGAIMSTEPPPISSLQPMTPPALERVVKKCLAKEREDRWQSAKDLTDELQWIAGSSEIVKAAAQEPKLPRKIWQRPIVLAIAGVAIAVLAATAIWKFKPAEPQPVTRTVISLPPDQRLAALDEPVVALSSDGSNLAYAAVRGGTQQIFLRALDSLEARPMPGTEGGYGPFFSPDGQWLGFFQGGALKKVSVSGGAAVTLSQVGGSARGATWDSQGTIIFAPATATPLWQVSKEGGDSKPLARLDQGEATQRWPRALPGGKAFLYASGAIGAASLKIIVQPTEAGKGRDLALGGTSPQYARSGHLLYVQGATLMAVPFDPERLEIRGSAVPVVEGVAHATDGAAQYSISDAGSLVYVSGGVTSIQRKLLWVSRNGTEQVLGAPAQTYGYPRISPDGRRVALETEDQIWLYDLARDTLTRFTFEGTNNQSPVWTPDGKRIAFYSNKEGPANIWWQLADGSGGLERLTTTQYPQIPRSWSPDGQLLAFHENNPTTKKDIWVLRLSDHKTEPFLRTPFNEGGPVFSPDGHWIAYISDESGRPEIYVQPYPGPGGKWQISTDGGNEPAWNRNGRELFYRSGNKMMAVDVTTQPTFSPGKPKVLFEGQYVAVSPGLTGTAYDVSPDGQRFLMVKETEASMSATQINVVLNWFEELKRRAPVGTK